MNKNDLIGAVADKTTVQKSEVEKIIDATLDIITNTLKVDREKVTLDASFNDDLKADSLDLVELIMAFEEEYGVEIPDEEARKITTVGAALAYVKAHGTH